MEPRYGLYCRSPVWSSFPQSQRHRTQPTGKIRSWKLCQHTLQNKKNPDPWICAGWLLDKKERRKRKADRTCVCALGLHESPVANVFFISAFRRGGGDEKPRRVKKDAREEEWTSDFCTNGRHIFCFEVHHRLHRRDHSYLPSHVILNEWTRAVQKENSVERKGLCETKKETYLDRKSRLLC